MRRNARQRTAAALLAMLAQALLLLLFLLPGAPQLPDEQVNVQLIVMQVLALPPVAEQPAPERRDTQRRRSSATLPAAQTPTPAAPTEPASAINVPPVAAPRTDWARQLQITAARQVQIEADREQNGVTLDSKPRVLKLPARAAQDPKATVMPNGDVEMQYEKVICTHNRPSLAEHFDVWAQHRPAKCRKRPGSGASRMTLDAETLQPEALRQPLPLPGEQQPVRGDLP